MLPNTTNAQRLAPPHSGRPTAAAGQLENSTIRVQLAELQSPVVGRKCGIKDRRPLDPPPVVKVRLFELASTGIEHEVVDLSERNAFDFVCFVDLFPLPSGGSNTEDEASVTNSAFAAPYMEPSFAPPAGPSSAQLPTMPGQLYGPASTDLASSIHPSGFSDVFPAYAPASSDLAFDSANSTAEPSVEQILAYVDGVAIVQGTSRTPSLVGTSVVSVSCYDLDGRSALLGVFHDLAVGLTGRFVLRYRAANMLWRGGPRERPIVAECWGAPFEVYAAHSFPGLQESTEMTKQLSRLGVPVTVRQSERKKRKNQPPRKREMRRLERAPPPD